MSETQSHLSNKDYGYHMVLSTTSTALDARMKEWLANLNLKPFTQAFLSSAEGQRPILTDFDKLQAKLKFNPFELPTDIPISDERIRSLQDQNFRFSFQIELGLPDFPLSDIPPVIELKQEGTKVTYNMICKSFHVIALEQNDKGEPQWISLSQSQQNKLWIFQFTVNLDLRSASIDSHFNDLPEKTKEAIKNYGKDLFSIQQLFLDLNVAQLSQEPKIEGLDPDSMAFRYLKEIFIKCYVNELASNGGIMLGFAALAQKSPRKLESFVPTDLSFVVSAHKDRNGNPSNLYKAYTLNYLLMSKGSLMPYGRPFPWNWVEQDKIGQYAGVVSINKDVFRNYLNQVFSSSLTKILKTPDVSFKAYCLSVEFGYGFKSNYTPYSYQICDNKPNQILTFNYQSTDSAKDYKFCGYVIWGNIKCEYKVNSDVFLIGNTIRLETIITVYMNIGIEGGSVKGDFCKTKVVTTYQIAVDSYGQISCDWGDGPKITDESDEIEIGFYTKLITAGEIKKTVKEVKQDVKNYVNRYIQNDASQILELLNGGSAWVFPGSNTFSFLNVKFSDHHDLVANVIYTSTSLKPEQIKAILSAVRKDPSLLYSPTPEFILSLEGK